MFVMNVMVYIKQCFLLGYREQLVSGDLKFAEIASTDSDCSSAKKAGDLGPFGKGQMQS